MESSSLENETVVLSRNACLQGPSDLASHPRNTNNSAPSSTSTQKWTLVIVLCAARTIQMDSTTRYAAPNSRYFLYFYVSSLYTHITDARKRTAAQCWCPVLGAGPVCKWCLPDVMDITVQPARGRVMQANGPLEPQKRQNSRSSFGLERTVKNLEKSPVPRCQLLSCVWGTPNQNLWPLW